MSKKNKKINEREEYRYEECDICDGTGYIFEDFSDSEGGEVGEHLCKNCG